MLSKIEVNDLLDYYGGLLTEKQQKICQYFYREDFSLSEIAEIENISRAAVHDTVKRCEKELIRFEENIRACASSKERETIYRKIEEICKDPKVQKLIEACRETEREGEEL